MPIKLHPQLAADCFLLGTVKTSTLLLHKNALIPWFILVPDTDMNEVYKLSTEQQQSLQLEINTLAAFTEAYFNSDKLNIASIGNIVPQLHIHIISRKVTDFCWPSPVWGATESSEYTPEQLSTIKLALGNSDILSKE